MPRIALLLVALSLTLSPSTASLQAGPAPASFDGFAADLDAARLALAIPGMAVAVVRDGEIVFAEGFGLADIARGTPVTEHTPFGLASVTKPIAATLVMQLVAEGAIDLDAPIADYGVTAPGADVVTSRHLLTHTSEGTPGTRHDYNGNRYTLLGGVIEGATGRSFSAELGDRILLPLGMDDTALNPIDAWSGYALQGFEDFARALGWGTVFEHYPDVYRRLATPYQFAADYSIVPGMYHLTHSPAAGLVSSVADLAAFDLALDEGRLLSPEQLKEMMTAAYPIPGGHAGSSYGLGWYVQSFQGMRIEWHTGRWPPSTSALYARFPDHGLTLIALANTDNLTVPFRGLGNGDVMHSLISLVFYRHFLFPEIHGGTLPEIDWSAPADQIDAVLEAVSDPAAAEYLERELWATRQAFASSGRSDQAAVLAGVATSVFPGSGFRTDPLFTALAGPPNVQPTLLAARTMGTISWAVLVWICLAAASLLAMMVLLLLARTTSPWRWAFWLAAAIYLGPVGPVVHAVTRRRGSGSAGWQDALASAAVSIGGYAAAWALALMLILSGGEDPGPMILVGGYGVPLLVGLFGVRGPLWAKACGSYLRAVRRGLTAELTTLHVAIGVLFGITLVFDNRVLSTIPHPSSPYFFGMIAIAAIPGAMLLWPLHLWIARRGFDVWPAADGRTANLPGMRDSWWMPLVTLAVMVGLIAVAAVVFA